MKTLFIGLAALLLLNPSGASAPIAQSQAQQEEARVRALRAEAERAARVQAQRERELQAAAERRAETERAQAVRAQRAAEARVQGEIAAQNRQANVRLDLAITDQTGTGAPVRKKISLLLADRGSGRVRSSGMVFRTPTPDDRRDAFNVELNVDAQVQTIVQNRVRVGITVEYSPAAGGAATTITADENTVKVFQRGSPLSQSVEVILVDGKPTIIVEAADPASDRKVTLEATATILR